MQKKRVYIKGEIEQKVLLLHSQGMNSKDIAHEVGVSISGICRYLKKHNLQSNNIRILSNSDKANIVMRYTNGETIQDIHKDYKDKCSEGCINYLLRKENVTRRNGTQAQINHTYFECINNEHKAYWLGFILADGSVRHHTEKGRCYSLRVELKYLDKYLLEELIKDLGSNKIVKETFGGNGFNNEKYTKPKHNCYVSFNSEQIFKDLNKYGIIQNKTKLITDIPKIPQELMQHFIRGYFDGDGTVYLNSKCRTLRVAFYGTYSFISNLRNYLAQEINLNMCKVTQQQNADVSFVSYCAKNNIKVLYEYMYKDATIFLTRKKELFDKYM